MEFPFPPPAEVPFAARVAIASLYSIAVLEAIVLLLYSTRKWKPQWIHAYGWALIAVAIAALIPSLALDPRPGPGTIPWPLTIAAIPLVLLAIVVAAVQLTRLHPFLPALTAIVAVVGAVVLIPPEQSVRHAARRTQCRNNLKQIGIAFHQHLDREAHFPTAVTGEPPVTWRVDILPFIDEGPLFREYNRSAAWNSPSNLRLSNRAVRAYRCPSAFRGETEDRLQQKFTSYAMLVGPQTLGHLPNGAKIEEITDGTSNTLAVIEACGRNIVWTEPRDVDVHKLLPRINASGTLPGESQGWGSSWHTGGTHALLADGSVRFVSQNIDPEVIRRLATIDGGEPIGEY